MGRGIDQVLPFKSRPGLYESFVKDARHYVPAPLQSLTAPGRSLSYEEVWGDALGDPLLQTADLRLMNLETSVTTSEDAEPDKPVLYRMRPENLRPLLQAAHMDFVTVANNHIGDWRVPGLVETLETLRHSGVQFGGIGYTLAEAKAPAVFVPRRAGQLAVTVFAVADMSSGVPLSWRATATRPGVHVIDMRKWGEVVALANYIRQRADPDSLVVVSIHQGSNWGWTIPREMRRFAHHMIRAAGVDLVHGHSSHHFRAIEVYRGKLILYGCGDFINDYETIVDGDARQVFLPHVNIGYVATYTAGNKRLAALRLHAYSMKNFRLVRLPPREMPEVLRTLNRICKPFGTRFDLDDRADPATISWVSADGSTS